MNKKLRVVYIIIAILLFFVLGYIRDFIFVNTNDQLYYASYYPNDTNTSGIDGRLSFLKQLSYQQLYYLKWLMTLLFSGAYFLVGLFSLKILFPGVATGKTLLIIYGLLVAISCLFTCIGILANDNSWTYEISRFLMGIAQSPIVIMLLIPSLKLKNANI